MYCLQYNESISTKMHEHYTFINENCCTIISARSGLPIELFIYHDRKEFSIYHMYDADKIIADDISECIDNNLEFLGADEYDLQEITTGNCYFIDYMKRKYGVDNENN